MLTCDFEVNQTKIKGGCQSGKKVVSHDSKSDFASSIEQYISKEDKYYDGYIGGTRDGHSLQ